MEKSRLPSILEEWEEGEVKSILEYRKENRTPAVNKPIEALKLSSKDEDIERVRGLAEENYLEQPERRQTKKRPAQRPAQLKEQRAEPDLALPAVRKSARPGTKMGTRSAAAAATSMSPKRKLEDQDAKESPKRSRTLGPESQARSGSQIPSTSKGITHSSPKKSPKGSPKKSPKKSKKLPTARKSTTTTPKKRSPPPEPLEPLSKTLDPNANQTITLEDLNDSLVEVSSNEDVVEINKDSTTVVDWDAREIKQELIEETEAKTVDPPTSPANVED